MQTEEVLRRYAAGERDFKQLNLSGASFKGASLAGADFSNCDLRGANFTGANLTGARFRDVKTGLQKQWAVPLAVVAVSLSGIIGFTATGVFTLSSLAVFAPVFVSPQDPFPKIICIVQLIATYPLFAFVSIRRRFLAGLGALALGEALVLVLVGAFAEAGLFVDAFAGAVLLAGAGALAAALALMGGLIGVPAIAGAGVGAGASGIWIIVGEGLRGAGVLALALIFALALTVLMSLLGEYLRRRALKGDPRDPWLRRFTLAIPTVLGTCFSKANLTDADFTGAYLRHANFRLANLTGTRFRNAKKLNLARYDKMRSAP